MPFSPSLLLAVAVGGALGSVARYCVVTGIGQWLGAAFPFGTLAVNALGCFAMGVLAELGALVWQPAPELRAMLMVGVLGGFTTFSSFALDIGAMTHRHEMLQAAVYVAASLVLAVGGFFAGLALVRTVVSTV